jgi:hypothetical protein
VLRDARLRQVTVTRVNNAPLVTRRRATVVTVSLIGVVLALLVQFRISGPQTPYLDPPPGWPVAAPTKDLPGALNSFHLATLATYLSANDYARITAYGTEAYHRTRWERGGDAGDAHAAFVITVNGLMKDTDFVRFMPPVSGSLGGEVAAEVLAEADQDGYEQAVIPPRRWVSPLDIVGDRDEFSWRPPYGYGSEVETAWGTLRTHSGGRCDVPVPPVKNIDELRVAAASTLSSIEAYEQHPESWRISSLVSGWTGSSLLRSDPVRIWLQTAANVTDDAGLSEAARDRMLRDTARVIHDAMIESWRGKYTHLLVHPISLFPAGTITPAVPNGPSYPSEHAAVASAVAAVIDHHAPGTPVRVELAGSLTHLPTTRVLADAQVAAREAADAALLLGLTYPFDLDAGSVLGRCVAAAVIS